MARERNLYWFLYLGEIDLEEATSYLLRLFPDEAAEERLWVRGKTTMAAVVLDAEGRPIDERVFFPAFPGGLVKSEQGGFVASPRSRKPRREYAHASPSV